MPASLRVHELQVASLKHHRSYPSSSYYYTPSATAATAATVATNPKEERDSMEEPDYDDLIEDFMDDLEEPPPSAVPVYDDDFLEEMEATTREGTLKTMTTTVATPDVPSPTTPISRNLPSRLQAASSPSGATTTPAIDDVIAYNDSPFVESPAAQVRSDFASSRSREGVAEPGIYTFERFVFVMRLREASGCTLHARY